MDPQFWTDPDRTVDELVLKLGEEVGEVLGARSDHVSKGKDPDHTKILEEVLHVQFIAGCLEKKILGE